MCSHSSRWLIAGGIITLGLLYPSLFGQNWFTIGQPADLTIQGYREVDFASNSAPATSHPRLWLRGEDLPRLRSWAVSTNPVYENGLAACAANAKEDMDSGLVPAQDTGGVSYEEFPTEQYAELFAFMSLISPDTAERDDYASRSRSLLMYVMNEAVKGPAEGLPFRDPTFALRDRSRWHGEAFALTVDWIYPYLSTEDKATIRQVFLRWADENLHAETTSLNHPEPIGVVNDPILLSDPNAVRWSGNNYYCAHTRNIGLMSMCLDPVDDTSATLRSYLTNATGAWLYVMDHLLRTDARGGLPPEGLEYGPQAIGYYLQFLLALHTAGEDDPARHGPQVVLSGNPFGNDILPAYLHSLSSAPTLLPEPFTYLGPVYQPAWFGAAQNYWAPDCIQLFGPLGILDSMTSNTTRLQAIRWLQTNTAPGGSAGLNDRVRNGESFQNGILYFLLLDPSSPTPADPRPSLPLIFFASGLNRLMARTSWSPDACWFIYALSWNAIDHQKGDGNNFEFFRKGEWLTKQRCGYDIDYLASDNLNTLCLENDPPYHNDPGDYRRMLWERGSQWLYSPAGDPKLVACSFGSDYVYALGDATNLYNSTYEGLTDILHASRSILWLKPDLIFIYDRAVSKTANRFKRFWLSLPNLPTLSGNRATMVTDSGQRLFITTLLPTDAVTSVSLAPQEESGDPANAETMRYRFRAEAPGGPIDVRFLHVLQGSDAGSTPSAVLLIQSTSGASCTGVIMDSSVVIFPVDSGTTVTSTAYLFPSRIQRHYITGLQPGGHYSVSIEPADGNSRLILSTSGPETADSGGVLVWPATLPTPARQAWFIY